MTPAIAHRAEQGKDPKATSIPVAQFRKELREKMAALEIDESFIRRYLNEGFSGGEKKRIEILQMAMLKPDMAIMDELARSFERALIAKALAHTGGRRIEASQLLGLGRNTLTRKIQELGLDAGKDRNGA